MGNFLRNFGSSVYWRIKFIRRWRVLKVFFTILVVKRSDVKKTVERAFNKSENAGYKKLHQRTVDSYAGLSKRQVLKCSITNRKLRKFTVKFTNRAKPRAVTVKRVQEQNQIDLVEYNGKLFRYILSLMDIFFTLSLAGSS